ncbi:MAG: hypothetical protein LBO03_00125 [Acidaminococcales bacterium]|nr:hypothetical protein [Acidaminococcales bacterium]
MKKFFLIFALVFALSACGIASAEIERTAEPFSGAITYTSKYMFSDDSRNMHSIALVRTIKPLRIATAAKKFETDTYFLLNFTLQDNATLGDTFDIKVSERYINALPLSPVMIGGIGLSRAPTARTGPKELPDMTTVAIEKGQELIVRVNFSPRGNATYTIPEAVVKEWIEVLKITGEQPPDEPKK